MGEKWLQTLIENIQYQLRHAGYDRSIEIAEFSRRVSTGKNQDEYVKRYRRFEDEDLQKQRLRLYNPLTKSALSRPRKYFKKLNRVEGIMRSVSAPSGQEVRLQALIEQYKNFVGGKALEDWLFETLEHLGATDPNAWIFFERKDSVDVSGATMYPKVFPHIFSCAEAVNYAFDGSGNIEWFLARTYIIEKIVAQGVVKDNVLENYYLYAPGFAVRAREIGEKTVQENGEEPMTIEVFGAGGSEKRVFYVSVIKNGTTEVPGYIVGAYKDEETPGGTVKVPWFYPAEHVIHDLIRNKSLCDTLSVIYSYPKVFEMVAECDATECEKGFIGGNQDEPCKKCKGTGEMSGFTTEQARIRLRIPKEIQDPNAIPDLSKLSYSEPVDITLLEHLERKVDSAEQRIMSAVFDSGLYQKPNGTETVTATEIDSIMEGISDVLMPYANVISWFYELAYRVGGQYFGIKVDASHDFPDQLDINSLADEVAAFDAMDKSGVGLEAVQAQRKRVLAKLYEGRPEELRNIEAKYRHEPFSGKTREEIAMIIASRSPIDRDRVLWENFEAIFQQVFYEKPDFANATLSVQTAIVDQKIEEYKARVALMDAPPAMEPNFNANTGGTNQPSNQGGV